MPSDMETIVQMTCRALNLSNSPPTVIFIDAINQVLVLSNNIHLVPTLLGLDSELTMVSSKIELNCIAQNCCVRTVIIVGWPVAQKRPI